MLKNSTQPILMQKLFELLAGHRGAFGQERIYWRAVGLVLGEIFNFGRHTVTQVLMVLGITDGDWSAWYRLFSHRRYREERVAKIFLRGKPEQNRFLESQRTHLSCTHLHLHAGANVSLTGRCQGADGTVLAHCVSMPGGAMLLQRSDGTAL